MCILDTTTCDMNTNIILYVWHDYVLYAHARNFMYLWYQASRLLFPRRLSHSLGIPHFVNVTWLICTRDVTHTCDICLDDCHVLSVSIPEGQRKWLRESEKRSERERHRECARKHESEGGEGGGFSDSEGDLLGGGVGEVGGWGRDPKKFTGRDWGMGSSTI